MYQIQENKEPISDMMEKVALETNLGLYDYAETVSKAEATNAKQDFLKMLNNLGASVDFNSEKFVVTYKAIDRIANERIKWFEDSIKTLSPAHAYLVNRYTHFPQNEMAQEFVIQKDRDMPCTLDEWLFTSCEIEKEYFICNVFNCHV